MPIDPNHPVDTPFDKRINHLQNKIHKDKGPNDRLKNKLNRLKVKQFGAVQSTPTPVPWSAAAETAYGNATRDYNTTTAGIQAQQLQTNYEYGGPSGDNSNPFSRAAMLQQAYQRNVNSTMNNYAARGQLYAGSFNNAQAIDSNNLNQGADALLNAYKAQSQQYSQANLSALTAETDAQKAAYVQALQDALNTRPEGTPNLPGYVKKFYKQKINKAEQHHKGHKADKLRKKLQNLKNPNPMTPTVAPKP